MATAQSELDQRKYVYVDCSYIKINWLICATTCYKISFEYFCRQEIEQFKGIIEQKDGLISKVL